MELHDDCIGKDDNGDSSMTLDRQWKLDTIRTVCQIAAGDQQDRHNDDDDDDDYAVRLLEAASGSVERAVQIHFDSQHRETTTTTTTTTTRQGTEQQRRADPRSDVQERKAEATTLPRRDSATDDPAPARTKRQKQNKMLGQGTLDRFLGLAPKSTEKNDTKCRQTKLDQFFPSIRRSEPTTESLDKEPNDELKGSASSTDVRICSAPLAASQQPFASIMDESDSSVEEVQRQVPAVDRSTWVPTDAEAAAVKSTTLAVESPPSTSSSSLPPSPPQSVDATPSSRDDVPYQWLAETLAAVADTSKRTAKLSALESLFRRVMDHLRGGGTKARNGNIDSQVRALVCTIDLILGKLSLPSESLPLQVSGSSVSGAVQAVTGATRQQLHNAYRQTGDFGDSASRYFRSRSSTMKQFFTSSPASAVHSTSSRLTVTRVHDHLRDIATVPPGKGSQAMRKDLMIKLLRLCQDKDELRFLVRILLGNMRLGATIKTVVAALAAAFHSAGREQGSNENASSSLTTPPVDPAAALQQVFCVCPRLDRIVEALLTGGIPHAVQNCSVEVFHPVQPMLANPARSLDEVRDLMNGVGGETTTESQWEAVAEWKYDGVRCQAHYDGTTVKLFSRNLLENTSQYPDAVDFLLQAKKPDVTSFILDSELVGVSRCAEGRDGFRLLPFQELSTRRAVANSTEVSDRVQIRIYAFDLLYINGESVLHLPLWRRQELLRTYFVPISGFAYATSVRLALFDEVLLEATLRDAVQDGAEGLMIKLSGRTNTEADMRPSDSQHSSTCGYQAGTRSPSWLKLKRDYVGGAVGGSTTVDVVPIGAWYGTGRKAKNGYLSPVLLAVYDDEEGVYYSISRCMSFSDEMYKAMHAFYIHGVPYPDEVGASENEITHDEDDVNDRVESSKVGTSRSLQGVHCLEVKPSWIVTNESPPIWFQPSEVFEVSFADLSLSTTHTAAMNLVENGSRGVALRFPRFKRRRTDKAVEQATTPEEVARLYYQQSKIRRIG